MFLFALLVWKLLFVAYVWLEIFKQYDLHNLLNKSDTIFVEPPYSTVFLDDLIFFTDES